MKTWAFLAMLLIAGCSSASKSVPPEASSPSHDTPTTSTMTPATDHATLPDVQPDGMPTEAFDLLTRSAADSCSICAKKLQKQAFEILGKRYPPGSIVRSDSVSWFMRAPGSANELFLTPDGGESSLTFRFHTPADHLVGVSEADWTDEGLADRFRSAPEGSMLQGALEVVPFEYGNGPTFLYHAASNIVEVQCRILELAY